MDPFGTGCCADDSAAGVRNADPAKQEQAQRDADDAARFGLPDPSELDDDPSLAGCCAEDLQNMRRSEALRNTLLDVDRSTALLRLRQQALAPPPGLSPSQQDSPLDSEEDDPVLADLRQRRLEEIQRQAAERQQAAQTGYGSLNEVAGAKLMETVEQLDGPAVVHLAAAGYEAGALLDEHLTSLAHRNRGTFFARVAARRGDALASRLRVDGLPGLVCFRGGAVVGRAPLSQFGPPSSIVEEEVTAYLRRLRLLRTVSAADGGTQSEAATAGSDGDEEEWKLKPCEVCGRRYPHEHVRAVYGSSAGWADKDGGDESDD